MKRWFIASAVAGSTAGSGFIRGGTGFSETSDEDARKRAEAAARAAAENGNDNHYPYGVRPLAEPVLREWRRGDGELKALLSVNTHGCVVLNTAQVMFVDVDVPKPAKVGGFLSGLFSRKAPAPAADPCEPFLDKLRAYLTAYPDWGFRVYRTAAGMRYLCSTALHDPTDARSLAVLDALSSDFRYRLLCQKQDCFRARLTPKPWRVNLKSYATHYNPRRVDRKNSPVALRDPAIPAASKYELEAQQFAVCTFIGHFGNEQWHPEAREVMTTHDTYTRPDASLPLA